MNNNGRKSAGRVGEEASEVIRRFYDRKFSEHGRSVEALGWQSIEKQRRRFEILAGAGMLEGKSVLDVGCGFGGLYEYLCESGIDVRYYGIDLKDEFIRIAGGRNPGVRFRAFDAAGEPPPDFEPPFDYVMASGLLGLRVGDDSGFAEKMLGRMFEWCKVGVAANLISTYVDYREDYLAYTSPEEIFAFCKKNLTWKVALRHDYLPHEFTLFLYR